MRRFFLFLDVLALFALIPFVMALFAVIEDRRWAATLAGVFFISVPLGLLWWRRVYPLVSKAAMACWLSGVLIFLLGFALPILSARLLNWELPFEEIAWAGLTGPEWHRWSSRAYSLMLVAVLGAHALEYRAKNKKPT